MNTLDSMIKSAKTTAKNVALATAMVYNAACGGSGPSGPSGTPTPTPSATTLRLEKVDTFNGRSFGTTDYTLTNGCADVTVDSAGMSRNWFAVRGNPSALVGPLYGKAAGTSSARICPTGAGTVNGVLYMYDNSVLSDAEMNAAYNGSSLGRGELGKFAWNRNATVYQMTATNAPTSVAIVFQNGNVAQLEQSVTDLNEAEQLPGRSEKVGTATWGGSGNVKLGIGYVDTPTSACYKSSGCHNSSESWALTNGSQSQSGQRGTANRELVELITKSQNYANASTTNGNSDGSLTAKGKALIRFGGTMAPDQ